MAYHTFVSGEVLTAANVMNDLMNQSVIVCTSGTRPASPVVGMFIFETDTLNVRQWNGTTWILVYNLSTNGIAISIANAGQLNFTNSFTTATAGGGGALPATVLGYLEVTVGGVTVKVPYYSV